MIAGYAGPDRPRDEDLALCTRCGMCEQACPTYRILHLEPDSPRGRVFLMRQVADGAADVNPHLAEHLYVCLGCRACETVCPSGVPYGRLLEHGRFQVENRGAMSRDRRGWRVFRFLAFKVVLPNRLLFRLALVPAQLLQRFSGLTRFLLKLPLPGRLRHLLMMVPPRPTPAPRNVDIERSSMACASNARAPKVAVFSGCVMSALFGHVNAATERVLSGRGCEVIVPRGQWCCGALNVHAGERVAAKRMARRNVDVFESAGAHAIVVNSAGCGAMLKEYGELLRDDPVYAPRAAAFAASVKDFSEFLCSLPNSEASATVAGAPRVTYQDACHLAHGQRIREQPRALIRGSGVEYVEMAFADRCCGAAGVYNLTHPELSERILEEKLDAIARTGCDRVVVTNPGCHMQLHAGLTRAGRHVHVAHLAELLDEATGASG